MFLLILQSLNIAVEVLGKSNCYRLNLRLFPPLE